MKQQSLLLAGCLMFAVTNVWAYGSSSSSSACAKPKFSDFSPADKAQAKPQSTFAFVASANTEPSTIKVTIKEQLVPVSVTPKNSGFSVTGKFPAELKSTFVRINIDAEGANKCKGTAGWLVNLTE